MSEMNNKQLSEMSLSELNKYRKQINNDAYELRNQIKLLKENLDKYAKTLQQIDDEKEHREHMIEAKKMIDNVNQNIKDCELLTNNELEIIIRKMDTKDYRFKINHPRFTYLKSMCDNVINLKLSYPNYELIDINIEDEKMESRCKHMLRPRIKVYVYTLKDENGYIVHRRCVCDPVLLL